MLPYRELYPHAELLLKKTVEIAGKVIVLPTGTNLNQGEIETIAKIIRALYEQNY
jgi:dTDP-4-amino-4,6-dideoxygalactose transaminase